MKREVLAEEYLDQEQTIIAEIGALAQQYDDIINLSLGDPDYPTNSQVTEAAFQDAQEGYTRYTAAVGDPELRREIIKYNQKEFGYEVDLSQVMVTVGACHGMFLALESILDEGDEVIVPAPYFTPYLEQIRLAGGKPVILETTEDEGFQINAESLQALVTDKTKAVIINTPNNPTGVCFSEEVLTDLEEVVIEEDLIIFADEVYGALSFKHDFVPLATRDRLQDRTITVASFSKDYAMTGWRVGYVIAPDFVIDSMQRVNEGICYAAPSISQRAALHALRLHKEIQPLMVDEYKKRVNYAYQRIKTISNMSVLPPEATFYLFVNIKDTGLSSAEVSKKMLEEARVLAIPGTAFGECGEGYIRIACTVDKDKLKSAFDRLAEMKIFNQ
ncbi:pyridoxal phosphate-dependent aminotransferase [Acetohalobium arabaticum]|uniref:Aminotransferase n=1 Tax=Acetohalobium arabaticum (strain ATCC 49924 / DSM 5501 / Z-7288) TaxID=574087 RepID=D9QR63_ACEAZ|nr:pyridoxal phosphate-dependent aminotransferase [Acetohalobium arabaticum]ADL13004.1 aminotransferase class I and II [Acetohalobium arabaticum DSM 5501]